MYTSLRPLLNKLICSKTLPPHSFRLFDIFGSGCNYHQSTTLLEEKDTVKNRERERRVVNNLRKQDRRDGIEKLRWRGDPSSHKSIFIRITNVFSHNRTEEAKKNRAKGGGANIMRFGLCRGLPVTTAAAAQNRKHAAPVSLVAPPVVWLIEMRKEKIRVLSKVAQLPLRSTLSLDACSK